MSAYTTKEEILALAKIDRELDEFLKKANLPKVDYTSLKSFKEMADRRNVELSKILGDPPAEIQQSDDHYTTQDGTKMRVKIYQPTHAPSEGSPLVMMIHGGGFCIGMPEGEEQTCRNLVHAFGTVCVSISYRLAPEFPFPHAPNDCWDALQWTAKNAKRLGADPNLGFIVGGSSAGGNLTAVLTLMARDTGFSPPLTGQYLAIPAVGSAKELIPEKYQDRMLSMEQNKDAPVLPKDAMDMFMDGYKPDESDRVKFNVIAHPKGHQGLPPTFFQVDGLDPLRDEGLVYEQILKDAGVQTRGNVYVGLPHGHWGFFPYLKGSARFRKEQVEGFGWLLGREPKVEKVTTQMNPTTI